MSFTPENLCGFLIRSRLMTPEEMRNMFQRWQAEAKNQPPGLASFTRWLVTNQYLTEYQATLLAKGHAEPEVYFLNQYKILDRLGRGRMAGVYRAVHGSGQVVAIKVLPPSRAKNPMMLSRFQREARLALRLKHPNVVRSFQIGQAAGLHFLVMEFLEGETLEEVLERRKRLPPQEAVRLLHQALTGLQHIHEQGMVHRDLKPSNLMLTPPVVRGDPDNTLRATVKILDIGLGRNLFEEKNPAANDKQEITGEGVILGTPDYLAPEQARDPRHSDIRADIYSLGCVLYHTLAGQPPFPDANVINQMVRHATETPKPLQQFNSAVPDGLQQIVNYMLAKQAAQRYPTPERAAQALQMFLMADSAAPKPLEEPPQLRKYLTWLETAPKEPDPSAVAKPAAGPSAAQSPQRNPVPKTKLHHKKHKKRKRSHHGQAKPAGAGAVANPAAAPPAQQQFDVELVALPAGTSFANPEPKILLGMTKRELTILGVGGGMVLAAVIVGIILGSIF